MSKSKSLQKLMAIVITVAMILSMTPISAFAADSNPPVSGEITAFEALAPEIAAQTVPLGTTENELNLPESLTATVDGETAQIAATWTAQPDYDGNTAGEYLFTAQVDADVATPSTTGGLTLANSVALPVITVTVAEAGAKTITAFAELADNLRWQNDFTANLPATVEATVDGETAQVAVTWEDKDFDANFGIHTYYAAPANGYVVASGVAVPKIAFVAKSKAKMAGKGTGADPLLIKNAAQLAEIAEYVNAGKLEELVLDNAGGTVYIKLANDIDLSAYAGGFNGGKGWIPIGNSANRFKGVFDGGGFTISNLYINDDAADGVNQKGLFGYVYGGTIKNVGVVNANIDVANGTYIGGVAGFAQNTQYAVTTIDNCYVTGSVKGKGSVGGVVGEASSSSVSSCYNTATVSGTSDVGGVAGNLTGDGGAVQNCYSTGNVTGTGNSVGGVVGSATKNVSNCYSTGAVSGTSNVGGVVGYAGTGSTVQDCAALNPSVKATSTGANAGRVVGVNAGGTLSGNVAFGGMKITINNADKTGVGDALDHIDGLGKTAAEITPAAFWQTPNLENWDDNIWGISNNTIPILLGIPSAAAQDNAIPVHIYNVSAAFSGDGTEGSPYPNEIKSLQNDYAALWGPLSNLLKQLSVLVGM